jgi:hypothetical protein
LYMAGRRQKDLTARGLSGEELRGHWAEWLSQVFGAAETSLATLTFATRGYELKGVPGISRVQRAGRRFASRLTMCQARPSFFVCMEKGSWNGRRHLHSLISCGDSAVTREVLEAHRMREGFVDLSHRAGSVTEYVTKYLTKSDDDFWLAGGPLFELQSGLDISGRSGYISGGGGRSVRPELYGAAGSAGGEE